MIADLRKDVAIVVYDRSFKDEKGIGYGTATWVIENDTGAARSFGNITVPGFPIDQSAYRSEAMGLYGLVRIASIMIEIWEIKDATAEISLRCDGSITI